MVSLFFGLCTRPTSSITCWSQTWLSITPLFLRMHSRRTLLLHVQPQAAQLQGPLPAQTNPGARIAALQHLG